MELFYCTSEFHLNLFLFFVQLLPGKPRGDIIIAAEEVADTKFEITLQLSATNLDKKDFFGKVSLHVI